MIVSEHHWRGFVLEVEHDYSDDGKVVRTVIAPDGMSHTDILEAIKELFPAGTTVSIR